MFKRLVSRRKPQPAAEPRVQARTELSAQQQSTRVAVRPPPPAYNYAPLSTPTATRICVLQPGNPNDPIWCSLVETDLARPHLPYTALSYCWDGSDTPARAACDGGMIAITLSLQSALSRLRALGVRNVWADGLCINQSKDPAVMRERAHQVKTLMGRIYSQAQDVIVDLGEAGTDTDAAIQFLQTNWSSRPSDETATSPKEADSGTDSNQTLTPDEATWRGISDLLTRKWFSRIWVVQEYVLASRAQAMIGTKCFDFEIIQNILHDREVYAVLQQQIRLDPSVSNKQAPPISLNLLRMECMSFFRRKGTHDFALGDLIEYSSFFEASIARDLIYGLLGLCRRADDLIVDYVATDVVAFQEVIRYLASNGHLRVLLARADGSNRDHGLPSWYTNFAIPEYRGFRTAQSVLDRKLDFKASHGYEASAQLEIWKAQLRITGIVFDRVTSVTATFPGVPTVDDVFAPIQWSPYNPVCVKKWIQMPLKAPLKYGPRDASGEPIMLPDTSMFWETLVGGRCDDSSDLSTPAFAEIVRKVRSFFDHAIQIYPYQRDVSDPLQIRSFQEQRELRVYFQAMLNALNNLRMCQTAGGRLGIVSRFALPGDMLAIFCGADLPSLLRRVSESERTYTLMGNAFVHGVMHGEAFKDAQSRIEELVLV